MEKVPDGGALKWTSDGLLSAGAQSNSGLRIAEPDLRAVYERRRLPASPWRRPALAAVEKELGMEELGQFVRAALGLGKHASDITMSEMALRAAVTFAVTLAIVRLGKKRLMSGNTAFDVIVGVIIGSTVSRGLTGNAPLASTLAAAAAIVAMHWLMSALALRWSGFSSLAKGNPRLLVSGGRLDRDALRRTHMTQGDFEEALRSQGLADIERVAEARLERSGKVSFIEADRECRVLEIQVADGVQTVRIEITDR